MTARKNVAPCLSLLFLACLPCQVAEYGSGMPTAASQYFGGYQAAANYRAPTRPAAAPQPMEAGIGGKPFQAINREPTLSPYLALDLVNDEDRPLPNYYAFYQPLRQQQDATQAQAVQLRRLQQQLRMANATGAVARNPVSGMPTTGASSQFMNLGGYFPGLR